MSGLVAKFVFNKILKETKENKQGREDPYFEQVPTKKLGTFSGKPRMKKRKKALPPGLSPQDEQTLVKVKRRAYRLDMALGSFLGMKIGWSSVIGLFPAVGDAADLMLALMVIRTASEVGLPSPVLLHMLFNIVLDFFLGLVPFLGDLADMAYKANTRNAVLLEDHLRQRGAENLRRQGQTNVPDPSLGPVEVEEGIVDDSDPGFGSSRTWAGNQRGGQYDVEAQRGAPQPSNTSNNGYGRSHIQKPSKVSRGGSSRGHARLYSQETGTT